MLKQKQSIVADYKNAQVENENEKTKGGKVKMVNNCVKK